MLREYGFEGIRIEAGVEHLGGGGHGRGGEVLNLLKSVAHLAHDAGEMLHVALGTAGMGGDEIRYELLTQAALAVYLVEDAAELAEELKRRFAHDVEHIVRSMLRRHLQATRDMALYKLAGILTRHAVDVIVLAAMKQEVVPHAGADERLLYLWQGIDGMIDIEQGAVVGIQVGTYLRMYARGTLARLARLGIVAVHAIHIG